MYGIFTYIYHKNQPNVGKYTSPMDGMGKFNTAKIGRSLLLDLVEAFWINDDRAPGDFRPSLKLTVRAWKWMGGGTTFFH